MSLASKGSKAVELSSASTSLQSPILLPRKSVPYSKCPFLDELPLEVRYAIYAFFLPRINQTIELSRPITKNESLNQTFKDLMLTCKKTRSEIKEWHNSLMSQHGITETIQYGPINPDHTIFSITVLSPNFGSCVCVTRCEVSPHACTLADCAKRILNRLGYLSPSIPSPFCVIRHLQLSFNVFPDWIDGDGNPRDLDRQNVLAILIAQKMTHLQTLDVFLHWGLSGDRFLHFWSDFADPGSRGDLVYIPVDVGSEKYQLWAGTGSYAAASPTCRVVVWHGPKTIGAGVESVVENPMQKLISWFVNTVFFYLCYIKARCLHMISALIFRA